MSESPAIWLTQPRVRLWCWQPSSLIFCHLCQVSPWSPGQLTSIFFWRWIKVISPLKKPHLNTKSYCCYCGRLHIAVALRSEGLNLGLAGVILLKMHDIFSFTLFSIIMAKFFRKETSNMQPCFDDHLKQYRVTWGCCERPVLFRNVGNNHSLNSGSAEAAGSLRMLLPQRSFQCWMLYPLWMCLPSGGQHIWHPNACGEWGLPCRGIG